MKWFCLCIFVVFATVAFAEETPRFTFQLGMGIDSFGQHNMEQEDGHMTEYDTHFGLTRYIEVYYNIHSKAMVGLGGEFQFPRGFIDIDDSRQDVTYHYTPVYMCFAFKTPSRAGFTPEVLFHLGYTFLQVNDDYKKSMRLASDPEGGAYFAFGAGFIENSGLAMTITYRLYKAKYEEWLVEDDELTKSEVTVTDNHVTFTIGYRF